METNLFTKEENIGFWKNMVLVVIFFTIGASAFFPLSVGGRLRPAQPLRELPHDRYRQDSSGPFHDLPDAHE